jgi:peptidoglycan hydrolase-like protein with peptidoglycan-binding domain
MGVVHLLREGSGGREAIPCQPFLWIFLPKNDRTRIMLSPLKLSVIVCGAAAGLAVAPYIVKQVLPPVSAETQLAAETAASFEEVPESQIDLPIAAPAPSQPAPAAAIVPVAAPAPMAVAHVESTPAAELKLSAPALPSPAPVTPAPEMALPSLGGSQLASAMPSPSITPAPTPRATPSPTPEIPYRAEVEAAQKLMKKLGIDTGKIDGKLGPNTQAAVRDFQKKHNLTTSGDVNTEVITAMEKAVAALATPTPEPKVEITDVAPAEEPVKAADDPSAVIVRKKITADAEKPPVKPKVDPGPVPTLQNQRDVKKIQEQLKLAGTYSGPVDGRWGDLTRAAMREFQEKAGVEITGKPNKETWLAMHSGIVTAENPEAEPISKTTASKTKKPENLEISSADSAPTENEEAPLVVNVNGDGVSDPAKVEPMATPSSVSNLDEVAEEQSSVAAKDIDAGDKQEARVKVSTPVRNKDEADSPAANETKTDLAVAAEDKEAQREKLKKEIESRRAQIKSVGNDYEVKKYAPKMLETVNSMVDDLKIETVSNNPAEAKERLAKIDKELERAKSESVKKKATETVDGVRDSYDALKKSFPTRIKSLSLKDDDQKALREELTELVAKVDLGFEAMEKDFKKGNYDPIFENGKDFRNTIDEINRKVADVYLEAKLDEADTTKKLGDKTLEDIKSLHKSEEHVKAAEKLDEALASRSSKKKS